MDIYVDGIDPNLENYDERGLNVCRCGCRRKYPSKKMFADFLEQYNDIDAEAIILLTERHDLEKVILSVEITYSIAEEKR